LAQLVLAVLVAVEMVVLLLLLVQMELLTQAVVQAVSITMLLPAQAVQVLSLFGTRFKEK
jgi:hypothetical protein